MSVVTVTTAVSCLVILAVTGMEKTCSEKRYAGTNTGETLIVTDDADIYDYTAALVRILGWTQAVVLSNEEENLTVLVTRLGELVIQSHVVHCTSGTLQSSTLPLNATILNMLLEQEPPNIVIAGTECLQVQMLNWLMSIPQQIGPMSSLVQDSHWLLVVDNDMAATMNMTSLLVNNLVTLVQDNEARPISLKTLTWTPTGRQLSTISERSLLHPSPSLLYPNTKYGLNGMTLRVGINTWKPYIMEKQEDGKTTYYGYSMDLLDIFASTLNFTYTLALPDDMEWGQFRDGKWTGVVGQIDNNEVDFSVAPLTPGLERAAVVDWTGPMNIRYTGIAVRMSSDNAYLLMALFKPFTWEVYSYIIVIFVAYTCFLALVLSIEARMQRKRRQKDSPSVFLILEFLFGSFLKEIIPSKLMMYDGVRRPLVAAWCVFGLLVSTCYTSKLTSLLVDISPPPPFESMEEMVQSGKFRWGVVGGTALLSSFKQSNNSVMKALYKGLMTFYQDDPDVLSLDAEVHRAKVVAGGYAYIGEESLLDLWAIEDCSMRVIGERIVGMETYNVFTPKRSVLTQRIEQVLLQLEAGGVKDQLKANWWPTESRCGVSSSSQGAITLATMQGAFYMAIGGFLLAVVALVMEKFAGRPQFRVWCPEWLVKRVYKADRN